MNDHDVIDKFLKAMQDAGITPAFKSGQGIEFGPSRDGKPHRFHVKGDAQGSRNGWYVLFGDGIPAGSFGSWKSGVQQEWCAKDHRELSDDERRAIAKRMEEAKAAREAEQREREGEAAKCANLVWNDAEEIHGDAHPYLVRKGVLSYGLRVTSWPVRNTEGEVYRHVENTLLVPLMDKRGKVISLQAIFPERDAKFGRDKDFMKDGKKAGGFFMIGRPPAPGGTACIVEGYATGATIHEATGWCVVVAFDAYNLVAVAKAMRGAMPECVFVIAADNDRWTVPTPENPRVIENPGVTYGRRAAAEIGARLCWPEFVDLTDRPTDFNDLHQREGIEAVQAQVLPPVAPPEPAPSTSTALVRSALPIDPDSVDTYTPFRDVNGQGKPLATIRNTAELLRRLGTTVRYNTIAKRLEIIIPGAISSIDNGQNVALAQINSYAVQCRLPTDKLPDYMLAIGDANPYNPVATWIGHKPWDGRSRLVEFYATVKERADSKLPDGSSLKELLMRKWLLSAVAAAFNPEGVVARGVLTFQSKQNVGKTYWAKRLAPKDMRLVKDGLILDPSDKDSVKKVVSAWIVELGEIDATFRKADIAALKAFVSQETDELRLPYARAESQYARRTVFFASVNDEQFLHDPTGNTRWWVIPVISLDTRHTIDMQQLWAEVHAMYLQAGGSESGCWHLTPEELEVLNSSNRDHESLEPVHERIDRAFDWEGIPSMWAIQMTATEIAERSGIDRPNKLDVNKAAAYVTSRYGVQTAKKGKARTKVWLMPPMNRREGAGSEPF